MKVTKVTVEIRDDSYHTLKSLADADGRTLRWHVQRAIDDYLKGGQTVPTEVTTPKELMERRMAVLADRLEDAVDAGNDRETRRLEALLRKLEEQYNTRYQA